MRGSCGVLNLGFLANIWFAHWALKSCFLPGFRTFLGREIVRCSGSVLLYSGIWTEGNARIFSFQFMSSHLLWDRDISCGLQQLLLWGGSVHICRRSRGHPSSNGTSFSSLRGYIILHLSYLFVISLFSYKSSFSIQPKKEKDFQE